MLGLMLKDYFNLSVNIKRMGISLIIFTILALNMNSGSYLVFMMLLMFSMMSLTSFSSDELAKWDKYALTMPISRKDMVISKYILTVILCLLGFMISFIIGAIINTYFNYESMEQMLMTGLAGISVAILFYSVLLPLVFKNGVEKARIMIFVVAAIPALLITGTFTLFEYFQVPVPTMEQIKDYIMLVPIILIGAIYISSNISIGIYEKKEF